MPLTFAAVSTLIQFAEMNITGDLVAFFTLKNRRVNSNNQEEGKDEDLFNEDTEETEEIVTTTEANYNLFEPGNNYFLGVFLSIIGM